MLAHQGLGALPVTLDAMVHHTRAVSRGVQRALVVADMPFLTYQVTVPEAVRNAGRLMQEGGAAGVKIEGGGAVAEAMVRLVEVGIPVMGHLGLLPQSVHQLGGFRQQATLQQDAEQLLADARALQWLTPATTQASVRHYELGGGNRRAGAASRGTIWRHLCNFSAAVCRGASERL